MELSEVFQSLQKIKRKREEIAKLIEKINSCLENAREVTIKTKNGKLVVIQPVRKGARIDVGNQEVFLNIIFDRRERGSKDRDKWEKAWSIDKIEEIKVN